MSREIWRDAVSVTSSWAARAQALLRSSASFMRSQYDPRQVQGHRCAGQDSHFQVVRTDSLMVSRSDLETSGLNENVMT